MTIKCYSPRAGRNTTVTITVLLLSALRNNRPPLTDINVYGVINVRYRRAFAFLQREHRESQPLGCRQRPSLAPKSGARVIFDCQGETTDE
ncbi:hypothetical protein X777_09520 [Ooceraea biroi]|uniref:Uncharacterized protein n=1 Tax=Ooceraea biroi TaxID=2015173 RepID=A0A026W704_OOCBI|nr:hypothetical protein X777_09520 [Ooceraea biroi]